MQDKTKRIYNTPVRIADYFKEHPNENISVFELMKEFGLTKDQVQTAMHRIKNMKIQVVTRGQYWKWTPEEQAVNLRILPDAPTTKTHMLFEYMGKSRSGKTIVRDEDQILYTLEEF